MNLILKCQTFCIILKIESIINRKSLEEINKHDFEDVIGSDKIIKREMFQPLSTVQMDLMIYSCNILAN